LIAVQPAPRRGWAADRAEDALVTSDLDFGDSVYFHLERALSTPAAALNPRCNSLDLAIATAEISSLVATAALSILLETHNFPIAIGFADSAYDATVTFLRIPRKHDSTIIRLLLLPDIDIGSGRIRRHGRLLTALAHRIVVLSRQRGWQRDEG
jgi:hypothetical protein